MFAFQLSRGLKNKKVRLKFKEDIEPQEIFLDSLAQKKEEEFGISEKKFEVPLLKKILQGLLIFALALILALFAKTFQLQVIENKNFIALAEENKFIIHRIQAERGVIYDQNLNQLVFNQPSFDLICKKAELPQDEDEREKILKEVSGIIADDFENLKKKIEEVKDTPQVLIAENLDQQALIILETKIKELSGFQIENNMVRDYPGGPSFSHLIGYKRKTGERTGLEKSYDEVLKEKPGELLTERDAKGNLISQEIISLPESGKSLVLWLDSELQKKIEEELKKGLKTAGSEIGLAVAISPKTGGVLALIGLPSFDNNLFSKGITEEEWQAIQEDPLDPIFNRVIAGRYPTGSTIKPLIASAALEEKIISPNEKINCQGKIMVESKDVPGRIDTYHDWKIHGWTDIRKAIAQSCNVFFYTVGGGYGERNGLGPTRIKHYLSLFGWGDKTGIDLPGEVAGFIPDKEWKKETFDEGWWDGDTYYLSIGQGYLKITPLEVAASFVPIANGGKLFRPQVVREIVDEEKNIVEEIKPKIIRQNFIDPRNLQIVREGMREAVTYGSSVLLNDLPIKAAAKTGTAETGRKEKGEKIYHNWITVFAPYEDPQIVLTIVIENIKGMQPAVQPVAKAILEWYFTREHNF